MEDLTKDKAAEIIPSNLYGRLMKRTTVEMIPDGIIREIAEVIGIEKLIKVAGIIGGTTLYFPKPDSLLRPARDKMIRDEFNGYNHFEIAKKYDITDKWVREICGEGIIKGQISIDELA